VRPARTGERWSAGQLRSTRSTALIPASFLFELQNVSTRSMGGAALKQVSIQIAAAVKLPRLAGISGNGQAAPQLLLPHGWKPVTGDIIVHGEIAAHMVAARGRLGFVGLAEFPKTSPPPALIGDMSGRENMISGSLRRPRFSRLRISDLLESCSRLFAQRDHSPL